MQPDTTWDDFTARREAQDAGEDHQLAGSIKPRHKRRTIEAKQASLTGLLMQAIHLAGTRRGRLSQAESVREQTLLEVLTAAIRRTP